MKLESKPISLLFVFEEIYRNTTQWILTVLHHFLHIPDWIHRHRHNTDTSVILIDVVLVSNRTHLPTTTFI